MAAFRPMIMGRSLDLIGTPNHYGLPAFYALNVWAWKDNPLGAFSMWNRGSLAKAG